MAINDQLIEELAEMTKLEFSDLEREEIKNDLNKISSFMEKLSEVDTDGVEPLIYLTDEPNILREDIVGDMMTKEEVLSNAPSHDSDYIKVPKFVTHRS
ncbi:MAG TPA: Asp-tRNA(Asn)/Glu-tRNA(Gln) amidotransferase subunit GatC [Chitinophagales bacterium]|nr:Asp-tRNA(Asn)/Glu-tRNA(Gln) amidotransferase subunit GatC [Chitinophagales bacterium]